MKALISILFFISCVYGGTIRDGSLQARSDGNNVTIQWGSTDESGIVNYVIERRAGTNGEFLILAEVGVKGSNSSYEYIDYSAFKTNGSIYQYRIKIVSQQGLIEYSKVVTVSHNVSSVKRTWGSLKAMFRCHTIIKSFEGDSLNRFFFVLMNISVPIILASQSPRRKEIFEKIGIPFTVMPDTGAEVFPENHDPFRIAEMLAYQKASNVAQRVREGVVIGADTIVVVDRTILGKPKDAEDAVRMLQSLSGKSHEVFTGFSYIDVSSKKSYISHERTAVYFYPLTDLDIQKYVETGSPMDKAGGYGIQDFIGATFIQKIDGDYWNVVGFPLAKFYRTFIQFVQSLGYMERS